MGDDYVYKSHQTMKDDGSNRLYDSWELVRLYGLYDEEVPIEPEGRVYWEMEIAPWEGRKSKLNVEKQ